MLSGSVEPQALLIEDTANSPEFRTHPAAAAFPRIRCYVSVPIILSDGTFFGTLCAVDPEPKQITQAHSDLLTILARIIAISIDRDRELGEHQLTIQQLNRQLAYNKAITSSVSTGLYMLDTEGCFVFLNPAAEAALGWSATDLVGADAHEFIHYQHADGALHAREDCPLLEVLHSGSAVQVEEEVFIRKDGTRFPVAYKAEPVFEEKGLTGAVVSFKDISKRKELDDMKDRFVSSVSHELRTPLTSIEGYLDALLEDEAGPLEEEQREFAEIAYRNANRLKMLVSDLLLLSKMESGKLTMRFGAVDVGELVAEVKQELRPLAESKDILLSLKVEPNLAINADPLRISQVLTNLVNNAIKFTPPRGSVKLRACRSGDEVLIEVADDGVGIPKAELPQLAERFFRASTASTIQGTGLGLTITKEILRMHQGELKVESEEGVGSTFRVRLPSKV